MTGVDILFEMIFLFLSTPRKYYLKQIKIQKCIKIINRTENDITTEQETPQVTHNKIEIIFTPAEHFAHSLSVRSHQRSFKSVKNSTNIMVSQDYKIWRLFSKKNLLSDVFTVSNFTAQVCKICASLVFQLKEGIKVIESMYRVS